MSRTWICLGLPPRIPACDATGTTQASAERHTKQTDHTTMTRPTSDGRAKEAS